ncbi:MAG: hypothetical protein JWO38_2961 [Gemmataceae bacterium]|nr:hypothetical protein [Gemmataceae bacterium]
MRVVTGVFTASANIRGPDELPDEERGRAIVEPFGHIDPDPDASRLAARTHLLGIRQVDLHPLPGQVGRPRPTTMSPSLRRCGVGRWVGRDVWISRWNVRVGIRDIVEQGRPGNPLGAPPERHPDEPLDVNLLPLDGGPQFGHRGEQFLVHRPQVRGLGPEGGEAGIRAR